MGHHSGRGTTVATMVHSVLSIDDRCMFFCVDLYDKHFHVAKLGNSQYLWLVAGYKKTKKCTKKPCLWTGPHTKYTNSYTWNSICKNANSYVPIRMKPKNYTNSFIQNGRQKYELVYIISYKRDSTNIPTYSLKGPNGGS